MLSKTTSFQKYALFGLVYGFGRSAYWLSKLEDQTYTGSTPGFQTHPLTVASRVGYAAWSAAFSQLGWPLMALVDLNYYEKSKHGVKPYVPPFPFDSLRWKQNPPVEK
jgi:hypothetical protein